MPASAWAPAAYYRDVAVQERIRECCGATRDSAVSCHFVSQLTPGASTTWERAPRFQPSRLPDLFEEGWDLSRSLLDTNDFIVHVEVEHSNPDAPGDALLRPSHAFFGLEPTRCPGYARRASAVGVALARCHDRAWLPLHGSGSARERDRQQARGAHTRDRRPTRTGAHRVGDGSGNMAQNVLQAATKAGSIPVVLNGVTVGRGGAGREAASIDLSEMRRSRGREAIACRIRDLSKSSHPT